MTAAQNDPQNDLQNDPQNVRDADEIVGAGVLPRDQPDPARDTEIETLRAEVARLHTLLVTENVGLSVGILMVHRRCGAREALAGLVELALSSGRTMAQEADSLVGRYDSRAPASVDVSRPPLTTARAGTDVSV